MSWPVIPASDVSLRTVNPIRSTVHYLEKSASTKPFISLSIGDPTVFGNFKIHEKALEVVEKHLRLEKAAHGYAPTVGYWSAREAVANFHMRPTAPLTANDVILGSGCSDALNLVIGVLCNEGQNILLPMPGFSLYSTIANSLGIETRYYRLTPEKAWEIDLAHLESLIDTNTACVLVNNPSNPCGSVYTKEHLLDILDVAEKHKLPIISDEIYADMVFKGQKFVPLATLSQTVPILTTGGLAKRYLVPGWRMGWVLIHDRSNAFTQVRKGLVALSQRIMGANSLIQSALPDILAAVPQEFYSLTITALEINAQICYDLLVGIPGLKPIMPHGAMYMMVEIKIDQFRDIKNDLEFVEKLMQEESVMCLPGQCFHYPNFFRVVITPPVKQLHEAFSRMKEFVQRHHV